MRLSCLCNICCSLTMLRSIALLLLYVSLFALDTILLWSWAVEMKWNERNRSISAGASYCSSWCLCLPSSHIFVFMRFHFVSQQMSCLTGKSSLFFLFLWYMCLCPVTDSETPRLFLKVIKPHLLKCTPVNCWKDLSFPAVNMRWGRAESPRHQIRLKHIWELLK